MRRAFGLAVLLAVGFHVLAHAQQAGSNVNVLPVFVGTINPSEALIRGDLFLQRQLEPAVAVSTRNPDHLLAAFNDYRAVDFVAGDLGLGEQSAPGFGALVARIFRRLLPNWFDPPRRELPAQAAVAEAWIGLSQSATGGVTWSGMLLPGSPVDTSLLSRSSPVWGLDAGTDPSLYAAPCGRFYLSFIAFDRGGRSKLAVARFEDRNNREDALGSIVYLDTMVLETGAATATGIFHDKPAIIVDPRRPGSAADPCAHNVYVSYTTFTGPEVTPPGQPDRRLFRSQVTVARSTDGGARWTLRKLNQPFTHNQGTALAVDPRPGTPSSTGGGTLYVFWRSFEPNTILMSKSTDFGQRFTAPVPVTGTTPAYPYDQANVPLTGPLGEMGVAFRSNAFPTAAVAANGNVFVAWQERVNLTDCGSTPGPLCGHPDPAGSPRIVMTMSPDGGQSWSDSGLASNATAKPGQGQGQGKPGIIALHHQGGRQAVDFADRDVDVPPDRIGLGLMPQARASGPQVMPRLSFGLRLLLAYYEARGQLGPTGQIDGMDRVMDVRAALLDPDTGALLQSASTSQVSQYPLKAFLQLEDLQAKGGETLEDVAPVNPPCSPDFGPGFSPCVRQVNRVNATHSGSGLFSFIGDYIDLTPSVQFVPDESTGGWRWATDSHDVPFVGHRTVFTDNRHLVEPLDGIWANYQPPGMGTAPCINPGSRNADVLTAQIDAGLVISGPTTFKFLDIIPRAFPLQVSNRTGVTRFFQIRIAPDDVDDASLNPDFLEDPLADIDALDVIILPYSSATKTLYVKQQATGSVRVDVIEISCAESVPPDPNAPPCPNPMVVPGGLTGSITYNLDATNPPPDDPTDDDIHNPLISNPLISNPLISNPLISNPLISNPLISNPLISNPLISNPLISNPLISNPLISNATIYDIIDVTWTASNAGNTSTAYIALIDLVNAAKLEAPNPNNPDAAGNYLFQLLIYRQALSAGVADETCASYNLPDDQIISVIQNPLISNALISNPLISNPLISNPLISNATYAIAPDDEIKITLRAFQLTATEDLPPDGIFADPNDPESLPDIVISSQAPNIEDGVVQDDPPTTLVITTTALPNGVLNQPYDATLMATGGTVPFMWMITGGALPPGLELNPSTGQIFGTPAQLGVFSFTVQVVDSSAPAPQAFTRSFSITIDAPAPQTFVVTTTADGGAGSLRQAILDANAYAGSTDLIAFDIAGAPPYTISVTTALPAISDPVILDATTEPDYAGVPIVELTWAGVPADADVTGFDITAGSSTVRGFVINRFGEVNPLSGGRGIWLHGGGNNVVAGNYIGTDPSGQVAPGNHTAVLVDSSGNRVGDIAAGGRNVISGNLDGVLVRDGDGNVIEGNYIGLNAAGLAALGNAFHGVSMFGPVTNALVTGNFISGNTLWGVNIEGTGAGQQILGNVVGLDVNGDPLGNQGGGIRVVNVSGIEIGDVGSGNVISGNTSDGILLSDTANGAVVDNTIAGNSMAGVSVVGAGAVGNRISANRIDANGALGIDLGGDGATANDAGDADAGPNNLQNFPILDSAVSVGGSTSVEGSLHSTANTLFALEFFVNAACDGTGQSEGEMLLGSLSVETDANGNANFTAVFAADTDGTFITATATDAAPNNTSEFSACVASGPAGVTFLVTSASDSGPGSLRQAILDANANAGFTDTISFNIPGSGPHTIPLASALPVITDPVIIDGRTQPGYAGLPLIALNGTNAGTIGLELTASNCTISGLAIHSFSSHGILITSSGNVIEANFIGTDPGGTIDLGNEGNGIHIVDGATNTIGGATVAARNLVSGNSGEGVRIDGALAAGNIIQGNYIGTDVSGAVDRGNSASGVYIRRAPGNSVVGNLVSGNNGFAGIAICGNAGFCGGGDAGTPGNTASGNVVQGNLVGTNAAGAASLGNGGRGVSIDGAPNTTVGGSTDAERNVISANGLSGVVIFSPGATGNVIAGNFIGTDATGVADLGNGGSGVEIQAAANGNIIGGSLPGSGNVIAFNTSAGVSVTAATGTQIFGNSIASNDLLGIDLGSAGVTPNDAGDADTGANNLQNFPVLDSAVSVAGTTTVEGSLDSAPSTTFKLQFFANSVCDPSGYGEGETLLGSLSVMTNVDGNADFTAFFPVDTTGAFITATVTDPTNNTSEFSACVASGAAPVTFTVTATNDSGPGSLRQAILNANGNAGFTDTIVFEISGDGPHTIELSSALPVITDPVIIDATTQPGYTGLPLIALDGTDAGTIGLAITADGCTISGLAIHSFSSHGILITGAGNVVQANFIGTDPTGTIDLGNDGNGIRIEGANNLIGGTTAGARNVIAGNAGEGILINGAAATGNTIQGNHIGTDVTGAIDLGNDGGGIGVFSANNTIGGTDAGARNVIAGNAFNGVLISSDAADGNAVLGNFIGVDATGTAALGNTANGVFIAGGSNNTVGGTEAGARNVISGNSVGVSVQGLGGPGADNAILGNYIGTDATGTADLGNTAVGIWVAFDASNTAVGGADAGAGNLVSGNDNDGILISDGANGTTVAGNYVGTDVTGAVALANGDEGVRVSSPATLGGTSAAARNVISGNGRNGVAVLGVEAAGTVIQGNFIGTNAGGNAAVGNVLGGILIQGAANTVVGGSTAGAGNVISGNGGRAIEISDAAATGNLVAGNRIGTNALGNAGLGNNGGIGIFSSSNIVGGTTPFERNVISGNAGYGVSLLGDGNQVRGNYIGTDVNGTAAIGNSVYGVAISSANNVIGGTMAGAGNLISGNSFRGIEISGEGATGNQVAGNLIGTTVSGTTALGNGGDGVAVFSSGNSIGGISTAERNIISGNSVWGVSISGADNLVRGNFIGTDITGTAGIGNGFDGVLVSDTNNVIGGTAAGAGNLISGNTLSGIKVCCDGTSGIRIEGNLIGTDVTGTADLGNLHSGVLVLSSNGTIIGGAASGGRNVISGNDEEGVLVVDGPDSQLLGNYIGTNAFGIDGLPNGGSGVNINANSDGTIIGGPAAGARNLISGNAAFGVVVFSDSNVIQGNFIGADSTGAIPLANGAAGIQIAGGNLNAIGGTVAGAGNTIAFNGASGIQILDDGSTAGNLIARNNIFDNGDLGIDLGGDDVTLNDVGDADAGGNDLQNFPVLDSAITAGGVTTVQGSLNSTPNKVFTLEFFVSAGCDLSDYGEGAQLVGVGEAMTDGTGNVNFDLDFGVATVPDYWITATATNPGGSTSEFSGCVIVGTPP